MFNQFKPFNGGRNSSLRQKPSSYNSFNQYPANNNFTAYPTTSSYNNYNFGSTPNYNVNSTSSFQNYNPSETRAGVFSGFGAPSTFGSTFANSNFANLGSGMLHSPIGVPQSNGFIPKLSGLLGGGGAGLGSKLGGLSISKIFGGVQRTVSTVNQVIPLYHQIKPIIANGKTVLKMMKAANAVNNQETVEETNNTNSAKDEAKEGVNFHDVIDVTPNMVKKEELVYQPTPKTVPNKPFFVE